MKYYKELARLGAFTLEDAQKIMDNPVNAPKQLNSMIKAGSVKRIKKNLYTCIDLVTGEDIADRFMIASHINGQSFISYHTAFEFYGFYNQVFYDVFVSSLKRFANFETDENTYKCYLTNTLAQVDVKKGVRVTSIERTIVDSINMLGKVMDVEELVKCLELVHLVDQKKLMEMLELYDKEVLYRKAGYILSFFRNAYKLDESFFDFCRSHSDFSYRGEIAGNELRKLTYIKEWSIYAYKDLFALNKKAEAEEL